MKRICSSKGWLEDTQKSALELALEIKQLGIKEIIYTDMNRTVCYKVLI